MSNLLIKYDFARLRAAVDQKNGLSQSLCKRFQRAALNIINRTYPSSDSLLRQLELLLEFLDLVVKLRTARLDSAQIFMRLEIVVVHLYYTYRNV